jgi:predicted Rossmann fold flavoprotein
LIIATGGLSIPKMGATDFGYKIAKKFNINLVQTRPALVPLTVSAEDLEFYKNLSGIAINSIVSYDDISFRENILFTHRGLSGPAILQISSYLTNRHNQEIALNLLPGLDLKELLLKNKQSKILITNFLKDYLPNRFVDHYCQTQRLVDFKPRELESVALGLHNFKVKINGTEGYAKAEVTAGGVDTRELSSKTMECLKIHGLYFIGEIVDVTGWLGGYNFQWAWSSGYVAGLNA